MKKYLLSFIIVILAMVSMPNTSLAANTYPLTITGEQAKFNTPYFLKDIYENYGGASFWPHLNHDYVYFHKDKYTNGTVIVFEAADMRDGVIRLDDLVAIKMLNSNWGGWNYWMPSNGEIAFNGVYLSNQKFCNHQLYSDSNTNSLGIGISYNLGDSYIFSQYYIDGSTWIYGDVHVNAPGYPDMSKLENRTTPFKLIEAN